MRSVWGICFLIQSLQYMKRAAIRFQTAALIS